MPDSENALIKQAFQNAENCLVEASSIMDSLDQAIEALQEHETELRESVTQSLEKADQLVEHCEKIVHDLFELRLKYRASHSTTGLPPEIDLLTETLARIEVRRRSGRHLQE